MYVRKSLPFLKRLLVLICLLGAGTTALAQTTPTPTPTPTPRPTDEVIRTFTELVQTDVMVFDKQGNFVRDLTRDNFELRIDGKVKTLQSFELITAGGNEEAQLAAARGNSSVTRGSTVDNRAVPLDRGRTVFFYVDDFHLDHYGLVSTKKVLTSFIEKQMGQNDQVAIASGTGQIGFLQQLTDDRNVLRIAISRLGHKQFSVEDSDRPSMGVYEAILIDRMDMDTFDFYIDETRRLSPGMNREMAASIVRQRAHAILQQDAAFTQNSLIGLERLVKGLKDLPGRKVVFFLSGGFHVQNRRGDAMSRLREITSAAAKSGVIIYSMDTRGLVAPNGDISRERPFDPSGRLLRATTSELSASQDGLNALAADTGGKFIYNTNDLTQGLAPAIKETSVYYLLAWKPDAENQKNSRFRNLQVSIVGRPDLSVRVRKGFFDVDPSPNTTATAKPTPAAPVDSAKALFDRMRETIAKPYPQTGLPVTLGINYYDIADKGPTVSTSVQVPGELLSFATQDGKTQAILAVTGVYFDDKGVPKANFFERIVTTAASEEFVKTYRGDITYTYPAKLTPGLYQVRVAARDERSGRNGSAHAWIEVPDLAKSKLTLSSLLLGERSQSVMENISSDKPSQVFLSANHRFNRASTMRFLVFAYKVTLSPVDQKPDVAVQVQVIRDDQPVITTALRKVQSENVPDLARIPYAAEVPLGELQPGRYVLQVSVIDRLSKESASRRTHFEVY